MDKELHGTYSINGDHQQCSGRRVATDCSRETSADSNPAMECLTKQNQILEEQLRQKVGHGTQEEDQKGTSAEQWDREGPERQNVSLPSLTDMTLPPISVEIQAIKEQMEVMMNALKGWVSSDLDDLVNRTDSPFIASVNSFPLPHKFRMPQIDSYDGVKDPLDHLETFKTLMHL